jgi:hypothetical protein
MSDDERPDLTGRRIRMTRDVWDDDSGDAPACTWAKRGQTGVVTGFHTIGWGYSVQLDHDERAHFGADRDEFELVEPEEYKGREADHG